MTAHISHPHIHDGCTYPNRESRLATLMLIKPPKALEGIVSGKSHRSDIGGHRVVDDLGIFSDRLVAQRNR